MTGSDRASYAGGFADLNDEVGPLRLPLRGEFPAWLTGALLRTPYDWTEEVRQMPAPVQLVYGDADSIPPAHAAEFFALLGGGLRDAGWDGSARQMSRLAVLPGRTHYDISSSPELAGVVDGFLG